MKTFIISLLFLQFLYAGVALAHETEVAHEEPEATVEAIVEAEVVTNADLGVSDPGVLPTSPIYFFKEMGRGLQRALTFNSVAKTELELKISSEKAAEAKKVAEENPNDEKGIERALLNYKQSQERLRSRLARLAEISDNPNIDKLLDKVTERIIVHEKLFAELRVKHETQKALFDDIENGVDEAVGEIAEKGTADRFRDRFERAFDGTRGSTLKHVRLLEIIDRLRENENLSDEAKSKLDELRSKLGDKAFEAVKNFEESGQEGADRVRDALRDLPGDSLRRVRVLEEIRAKSSQRIGDVIKDIREPELVKCTMQYAPVCGVDGKTYSNRCVAVQQNKVRVSYVGECRNNLPRITPDNELTPEKAREILPLPTPVVPAAQEITLEADDAGFYPSSEIRVKKGSKVKLTFAVRLDRVYYAGLDFRSSKFTTSRIDPGKSTTVEFTADESFEFKSYWPATGVLKATGRVIVE